MVVFVPLKDSTYYLVAITALRSACDKMILSMLVMEKIVVHVQ